MGIHTIRRISLYSAILSFVDRKMISFIWAIFWLGIAANAVDLGKRGLCPMHYVTGPHDQCFRFAQDKKNFNDALMQCQAEGGSLANTQSNDIYQFVRQHIEKDPVKADLKWGPLGLHVYIEPLFTPWANGWLVGAQKKGSFKWLDGQSVGGHWAKGRPDNAFFNENCLQQMASNDGWNDVPCSTAYRYICQRKVIDPCDNFKCGNGKCANQGGVAKCVCHQGWTGGRCADRVIVDPCAKRPCLNGGVCFSDKAGISYNCRCGVNFGGRNCEKRVIVDPCSRNPCLNGGVCFSDKAGKYYFCRCQGNFKGLHCEKSCRYAVTKEGLPSKLDAMILVDSSGSVGDDNFKKSLKFIAKFADKMHMGDQRLEVVRFTHQVFDALDFAASAHMSKGALQAKIMGIEYTAGGTMTGRAMNEAVRVFRDSGRKAPDVAKYLIVMTDGESGDAQAIPKAVDELKAMGVHLVAVGVGKETKPAELLKIAGGKASAVFSVNSFDELDAALINRMVQKICD